MDLARVLKQVKTKLIGMQDVDDNVVDILDRASRIGDDCHNVMNLLNHTFNMLSETSDNVDCNSRQIVKLQKETKELRELLQSRESNAHAFRVHENKRFHKIDGRLNAIMSHLEIPIPAEEMAAMW